MWCVITYPCHNFDSGFGKTPLLLGVFVLYILIRILTGSQCCEVNAGLAKLELFSALLTHVTHKSNLNILIKVYPIIPKCTSIIVMETRIITTCNTKCLLTDNEVQM